MSKRNCLIVLFLLVLVGVLSAQPTYDVKRVDFLADMGLKVNGAGPLLVRADDARNRIILVNTYTSSVSIIDTSRGKEQVTNIPIKTRVPQYLKSEALCIDQRSGSVYVLGSKSLHVVFPGKGESISLDTGEQYEMVAVDEQSGRAFLVGRESSYLAAADPKTGQIKKIKWLDHTEKMKNLNQTPPPPIRKVVCDSTLQRVFALDGFGAVLYTFSAKSGKLLNKRKIATAGGARWHHAGYNADTLHLYLVVETDKRAVIEALKIDVRRGKDIKIALPGLTEGVGIGYNAKTDQVYIPYDNHPSLHLVDFANGGRLEEIKIPTYGNDASALDEANDLLYVSSWGYGTVEVIDLKTRRFKKSILGLGIIPHMFNMAFNPGNGKLYIPLGATAVNGSFGAALTVLDPASEKRHKVYSGWAPVELIPMPGKDSFLVFNSEDECAEVFPDGRCERHRLPFDYPHDAVLSKEGSICLAYGPHQSYWPVVYIWAAKNGILRIDPATLEFYDRRIPRLAQRLAMDNEGVLYALQNNWGGEKQFLITLPDDVRAPNQGAMRLELDDIVTRETTQRILEYDAQKNWLYIARCGELDEDAGILQIFDLEKRRVIFTYPTGLTPTDLVFDDRHIFISNFDDNSITIIGKDDFTVQKKKTGEKPFKLALANGTLFVLNHGDNTLQIVGETSRFVRLPLPGKPGNIFNTGDVLVITSHENDSFNIIGFSLEKQAFFTIHREPYPYGETTFDTDNSAFYVRGQFGDCLFELNRIKMDSKGRTWITDYLSGKLFILSPK